jgi:hypothetical protein
MPGRHFYAQRKEDTAMAKQREATNLAEFVKFQKVGAAVFGLVTRQGENGNGGFVIMSPAGFRATSQDAFQRFAEVAVGMTTDLASKVRPDDTGKVLLFVFAGTKPTSKDPLKLFNVFELSADEARALIAGEPMKPEWSAVPEASVSSSSSSSSAAPIF